VEGSSDALVSYAHPEMKSFLVLPELFITWFACCVFTDFKFSNHLLECYKKSHTMPCQHGTFRHHETAMTHYRLLQIFGVSGLSLSEALAL
jgi:hypothetical protein